MKKSYILVIDSGLGGINILKEMLIQFPQQNFIYVLDNKNCPYGNKNKEILVENAIKIVYDNMCKYNIKLIVFACNTLTSVAIDEIRLFLKKQYLKSLTDKSQNNSNIDFNIKVVGTEPPIKMVNPNEKTLILSTPLTLKYNRIINNFLDNENFTFIGLNDVAKFVDENFYNKEKVVKSLLNQIPFDKYKNVVLGCTHYYYLENEIKTILNNLNLKFYTATNGVVNRVKFLLNFFYKKEFCQNKQKIKIILTKHNLKLKKTAKRILKN